MDGKGSDIVRMVEHLHSPASVRLAVLQAVTIAIGLTAAAGGIVSALYLLLYARGWQPVVLALAIGASVCLFVFGTLLFRLVATEHNQALAIVRRMELAMNVDLDGDEYIGEAPERLQAPLYEEGEILVNGVSRKIRRPVSRHTWLDGWRTWRLFVTQAAAGHTTERYWQEHGIPKRLWIALRKELMAHYLAAQWVDWRHPRQGWKFTGRLADILDVPESERQAVGAMVHTWEKQAEEELMKTWR